MKQKKLLWGLVIAALLLVVIGACVGFASIVKLIGGGDGLSFGDAVAIVYVEGAIVYGNAPDSLGSQDMAFSGEVVKSLERAENDGAVKAIVLYVNSPGGSVVASDEIYRKVKELNKPVVAYMGEMAASGGYYVSAPAKRIFADRQTLTGSIGVISMFLNVEGFMKEHGIQVTVIKSGEMKDEGSPFRAMTEEEQAVWQVINDQAYEQFVSIVAEGRGLSAAEVKRLADGRVYSGLQAKELGLVDELGDLNDAITAAAELGGIKGEPRIIKYRPRPSLMGQLLGKLEPGDPLSEVYSLLKLNGRPSLQYLYIGP
jgi:protease-4